MEKYRLSNGVTILFQKNSSKSVALEIMIKVGSNYENNAVFGISHFLEHMMFEGTKKRPDSTIIANEIEKYGAEFNAYTSTNRTAYFIKIINKHFDIALDILSDMIANPLFKEDKIAKEKKIVLREIDMVTDDPRQHQWILFQKTLFDKHPSKNPTYGTVKTVKSISRKELLDYYKAYYVPNNMIISVVGNIDNVKDKVQIYFGSLKPKKVPDRNLVIESSNSKPKAFAEKRNMQNSYIVLGYKSPIRLHKDSYTFDVIHGILGRGQSGWIFDEIRNKHGLSYQTGVQFESEDDYGTFSVFAGLDKNNIIKAKKLILQQFKRLQKITPKDLNEAKTYIEGHYALEMEENFQYADALAYWELIKDASMSKDYLKQVTKVTVNDVKRVAKKYLNKNYTFVVIEQK
jgi:predicted Zn-dependent peptidase